MAGRGIQLAFDIGGGLMGQIFKKRDRVEDQMLVAGIWVPLVMFFVFWGFELLPDRAREVFLVPCVFHSVTGFYCPGCGGTRAVAVLLEGNVLASALYHPIVAYAAGFYVWFMASHAVERLSGRRFKVGLLFRSWYLYVALAVVVLNFFVKNFALLVCRIDLLKLLDKAHALI